MWQEFLKIIPSLDSGAMRKMVSQLSTRFASVAKKFGSGLTTAIMGGGIFGLAAGILGKLLNPLKEVQETLEKMLNKSDDLVTNAAQFDTTAGKLMKLEALGKSTGLDPEELRKMMALFQVQLAEARTLKDDKTKTEQERGQHVLAQFAGDTSKEIDVADTFYDFVKSLQKATKDHQVIIQSQVFGTKLMGKASEFLGLDFDKQEAALAMKPADDYTAAAERVGEFADLKDLLSAKQELNSFVSKAPLITESMIRANAAQEQQADDQQKKMLRDYESLKAAQIATDRLKNMAEQGLTELSKFIPAAVQGIEMLTNLLVDAIGWARDIYAEVKKITSSGWMRGIFK